MSEPRDGKTLESVWALFNRVYANDTIDETSGERALHDDADHPKRLAAMAVSDDEIAVAALHDVVEDGLATAAEVADVLGGLDDPRTQAVLLLTRDKERETYEQYIERVAASGNTVAIAVKLYDLFDHLHPHRLANIGPSHVDRYTAAIRVLGRASCSAEEGVKKGPKRQKPLTVAVD